jgi:periplasmic protein TonB
MSLAATTRYPTAQETVAYEAPRRGGGAQGLLGQKAPPPNYRAQGVAAILYALAIGGVLTLGFRSAEAPVEEIQAIELAPIPIDEPPPDETPPLAEPETFEPPPPEALDPIAPVDDVKPPPKPVEKPRPEKKPEKPVERTQRRDAAPSPRAAARSDVPAARAPAAAPGVPTSAIANHFHACMQRAAANAYPESQAPRTARVGYHATFSATGSLASYTITPSGNAAFDAVANRLGGRCGSVPAPGKPVSLSGSLTFSP